MHVTTIKSDKVWESSTGDRVIWEVTMRADDGKEYKLKTYSSKISKVGFDGEVRSYLNPRGERFVRQVPNIPQRDDATIRAQWAIGQAINLASVKMEKEQITLPVIEKYAKELYATVNRVKGEPFTDEDAAEAEKHIKGFT